MSPDTRKGRRVTGDMRPRTDEPAPDPETGIPARPPGDRSLPDLLRELSRDGADLVRQEVALVRAEIDEKVDVFKDELSAMAVGGGVLLAALLLLVWAVNSALTALLALFMDVGVAVWLSPLLLSGLLAAIGIGMVRAGSRGIKREGVIPEQTRQTLKEDSRWARQKAHQVKEEVTHG